MRVSPARLLHQMSRADSYEMDRRHASIMLCRLGAPSDGMYDALHPALPSNCGSALELTTARARRTRTRTVLAWTRLLPSRCQSRCCAASETRGGFAEGFEAKRVCNKQHRRAVNRVSRLPNRDATDGSYRNLSLARTLQPSSSTRWSSQVGLNVPELAFGDRVQVKTERSGGARISSTAPSI
jgi:hypothetical protein